MHLYPAPCFIRPADFTLTWTKKVPISGRTQVTFLKYWVHLLCTEYSVLPFFTFYFYCPFHSKHAKCSNTMTAYSQPFPTGISSPMQRNMKKWRTSLRPRADLVGRQSWTWQRSMLDLILFYFVVTGSSLWKFYFCPAYSVQWIRSWGRGYQKLYRSWPGSSFEFPEKVENQS